MISINATLFLQILHFLILAYILNRFLFRPILNLINDREKHIEDTKIEAERIKNETVSLIEKSASLERNARIDAGHRSEELKREATEISDIF